MKNKKNILILANELQYSCGITSSLFNLLSDSEFRKVGNFFIICGGGDAVSKFKENGITVRVNYNIQHQKRSFLNYLRAHFQLLKFIREYKIHIIHSHHYYAASIAWNLKRIYGISTILSCHGLIPDTGILNHFSAEHIVAVNEHIYNYILSRNIKCKDKVHLIRYGVPVSRKRENNLYNKKIRFLAASRIEYEKGLDIFIKAVSLLPDNYLAKAEFAIAGKGSWMTEMMDMIKNLEVNIKYLGNLTEISKTFESNNVFVIPTRSLSEGFPMSIIEAAMNENLIITSDFRGSEYIIENEKDALVFSQNNYLDLSEKIKKAINEFESCREMINNFSGKVHRLYGIEIAKNKVLDLYESVIKSK